MKFRSCISMVGRADLVVSTEGSGGVQIFINNGNGTFDAARMVAIGGLTV